MMNNFRPLINGVTAIKYLVPYSQPWLNKMSCVIPWKHSDASRVIVTPMATPGLNFVKYNVLPLERRGIFCSVGQSLAKTTLLSLSVATAALGSFDRF